MFQMECPFCNKEMNVPDEMAGQTAQCPSCGQEVYLEDRPPEPRRDDARAQEIRTARAAAVAMQVTTMPKVTWEWAFEFVLKVSVAAAVIDGVLGALVWTALAIAAQSRR